MSVLVLGVARKRAPREQLLVPEVAQAKAVLEEPLAGDLATQATQELALEPVQVAAVVDRQGPRLRQLLQTPATAKARKTAKTPLRAALAP